MLKFIKLSESAKLEDLTGLAYQLRANTSGAALTAASEALILANPELRDKKRISKGTVLLVPDIGGRLPPAKEAEPVAIPLGQGGLLSDKQIESLAKDVTAAASAAKSRATETAALLKSAKTRSLIAEEAPGAEKFFDKILELAQLRSEAAQKQEKIQRKVFDRMAADMKRLRNV
ncbi:MAG TPA: hypothetical protein VGO61_03550 [Steroidobacteraceae bacterium]|jgi:hypothetical protein|nr:hypothetical protein [Steroidobacteraceae bacterium]